MKTGNNRRLLIRSGIVVLGVLCCVGVLGIRLISIFPLSFASPKLETGQPLGEGQVLAFSVMRVDVLRPFELYLLDDAHGLQPLSQGFRRADIGSVWSPDGDHLVYASVVGGATRYTLIGADGSESRAITAEEPHISLMRWSPDGLRLAYLSYDQFPGGVNPVVPKLCITEVASGATREAPAGDILDMLWMPDSKSILAIVRTENLVSFEVYAASGSHERRLAEANYLRDAFLISISPDGSKVAYTRPDTTTQTDTLNIAALDGSRITSVGDLLIEGPLVWSPDNTRIAFVGLTSDYESALFVADAGDEAVLELMLLNTGDESGEIVPAAPAWSSDGARLAISSYDAPDGAALFVMNADGTESRQILTIIGDGAMIYDLAWRPGE